MKKRRIRILIFFLILPAGFLIYIAALLILNTLNDYRPTDGPLKHIDQQNITRTASKDHYSILSWNIGYGGLGTDADFFYDGGKMVRPGREEYKGYWSGIQDLIDTYDSLDFILLQEVDLASRRSYKTKQFQKICDLLSSHSAVFATNYKVPFVPVPIFKPMGRVESGLALFSKYVPEYSKQIVFPFNYSWPKSLFMPDRCFLHTSIVLSSGKRLHILNTHNSAFDDGSLRNNQLGMLFDYMKSLYEQGDYVLAGGDWNINPPGYTAGSFITGDIAFSLDFQSEIFKENAGWGVYFDPERPSNRDVSTSYGKGQCPATIIDFYVCSPNISMLKIRTLDNAFSFSDHQPVYFQFYLN